MTIPQSARDDRSNLSANGVQAPIAHAAISIENFSVISSSTKDRPDWANEQKNEDGRA
jgi:hypothetical protein